jgi:hypothetical protein
MLRMSEYTFAFEFMTFIFNHFDSLQTAFCDPVFLFTLLTENGVNIRNIVSESCLYPLAKLAKVWWRSGLHDPPSRQLDLHFPTPSSFSQTFYNHHSLNQTLTDLPIFAPIIVQETRRYARNQAFFTYHQAISWLFARWARVRWQISVLEPRRRFKAYGFDADVLCRQACNHDYFPLRL